MITTANLNLDEQTLSQIVETWFGKMRDDYRINRYFYDRPLNTQTEPLKRLLRAVLGGNGVEPQKLSELADEAFAAAFARGNAKPSMVNNRDFAFLGALMNGNIVGDDDGSPRLTMLCPAHSHFLRLNPIDEAYDVAVELLQSTLNQLSVAADTGKRLLSVIASAKDSVMGRGQPIYDDENSSRFRTHG